MSSTPHKEMWKRFSALQPAEQPAHASSPVPMAKAKLSPSDLIEKFQLAATLNGIDWKELADS